MNYRPILGISNAKTTKGENIDNIDYSDLDREITAYLTGISYLAPHRIADSKVNLCPNATPDCIKYCLFNSGRGKFKTVKQARINKTKDFLQDKDLYMRSLVKDIRKVQRKALREGLKPTIRLNGTSDIDWSKIRHKPSGKNIFEIFPSVQFYDYTKSITRALNNKQTNYHLTFSYTGKNLFNALCALESGINVAMVFESTLPKKFRKYTVIDGDKHDLRFLDKKGVVVGLTYKKSVKKDAYKQNLFIA